MRIRFIGLSHLGIPGIVSYYTVSAVDYIATGPAAVAPFRHSQG